MIPARNNHFQDLIKFKYITAQFKKKSLGTNLGNFQEVPGSLAPLPFAMPTHPILKRGSLR